MDSSLRPRLAALFFGVLALQALAARDIDFGGMAWGLRQTASPAAPGPNTFSNAENQVWVDTDGRLHLTVQNVDGVWRASEVMAKQDCRYGTWTFDLELPATALDPNLVFGFFTWDRREELQNREIDIEISRWAAAGNDELWFTVQPYDVPNNQRSFPLNGARKLTCSLAWTRSGISFSAREAGQAEDFARWTWSGTPPDLGRARLRMNFWLFRGQAPSSSGPFEIIVSKLRFQAAD